MGVLWPTLSISLGSYTDYTPILPVNIEIESNNTAIIELHARNDAVTLEYDDDVLLLFTPEDSNLIKLYESEGEYIRDGMTVHIIDKDRKQSMIGWLALIISNCFICYRIGYKL